MAGQFRIFAQPQIGAVHLQRMFHMTKYGSLRAASPIRWAW